MTGQSRPVAVIVDGYTTGNFLPPAFAGIGADVVHVQSSRDLMTSMTLPDLTAYRANIVCDTPEEAARALAEFSPVAVVTGQEPGVEWTDRLNELLGLPGNASATWRARRDKYEMIEALRRAGVRCAEQFKSSDPEEIVAWAERRDEYPVVVKPLASAATDGVAVCVSADEVRKAAEVVLGASDIFETRNREVLVQSYLAGHEYTVDMVTVDGKRYTNGVSRYRKRLRGTHNIYDREDLLDPASPEVAALVEYTSSALDALGVCSGPTHAEVIITPVGPALVEVGARLSGSLAREFQDACVGTNQAHLTALAAVRPQEFLDEYAGKVFTRHKFGALVITATELDGIVEDIDPDALAELEALPSLTNLRIKIKPGGRIKPTVDLYTSTLGVHLATDSAEQLERDYERVQQLKDAVFRLR
ncbi:ATP-grasp domain-containing protein [Streptosporangium sp. NBC_01639]|uniref:ATP-grasp domain-containing protein n=1 Tax=Streptosporangium sp. NBC_01639 TaxID=2975948 RepID=UPI0038652148|nr:ATP-grasp domain-containing protein [Streptosporangium sp. NBC_01639]